MKISFDYEDLIEKMEEQLKSGMLHLDDVIKVKRTTIKGMAYQPIVDWEISDDGLLVESVLEYLKDKNSII